jgi:hypothetical protein
MNETVTSLDYCLNAHFNYLFNLYNQTLANSPRKNISILEREVEKELGKLSD